MEKNKTGKYFKYAIGEIILVVIGILIALQINNLNENRKENNYLRMVFAHIQKDLQTDTLNISENIKYYSEKNQRLTDIIERNIPLSYIDSINETNYANCDKCILDIGGAHPFIKLDKGYQLLRSLNTNQNYKIDSLSFKIDAFYSSYNVVLNDMSDYLLNLAQEPLVDCQKYDWFVEWSFFERKKYNKEFVTYIFESEEYRTKSARHLIYSKYYLGMLKNYDKTATEILKLLDEKLKK